MDSTARGGQWPVGATPRFRVDARMRGRYRYALRPRPGPWAADGGHGVITARASGAGRGGFGGWCSRRPSYGKFAPYDAQADILRELADRYLALPGEEL